MKKEYDGKIQTEDGKKSIVKWVNTNKLLDKQGYCGVKTGVTSSAGPCLSTNYRYEFYNFILGFLADLIILFSYRPPINPNIFDSFYYDIYFNKIIKII